VAVGVIGGAPPVLLDLGCARKEEKVRSRKKKRKKKKSKGKERRSRG
jgi:hypothetical protein